MISVWDSMLHNFIVLSWEPLAKMVPASLKTNERMPSCPLNCAIFSLRYISQTFIELSLYAIAKIDLLQLNAMAMK